MSTRLGILLCSGLLVAACVAGDSGTPPSQPEAARSEVSPGTASPSAPRPSPETRTTACRTTGEHPNRDLIRTFFDAYNEYDVRAIAELVDDPLSDLWDATAAGTDSVSQDLIGWVEAGRQINDRLEPVEVCVYEAGGADGLLRRSNDLLAGTQLEHITVPFKVQIRTRLIQRLVLYPPAEDRAAFCTALADRIAPDSPTC